MAQLNDAINPSALHTFSSPSLAVGSALWPPDSSQPCPEEEAGEPYSPPALCLPHAPHNGAEPTLRGRKLLSGKEFPFKLYSMLEDETVKQYATWSKIGNRDALFIPDVEAFVANVLPKHFKEMKKWGSFQRQLNNYNFERQDRGAAKALYAHVEDKFQRGHPELLRYVRRGANCQTSARPKQKRNSTPIAPTARSTTPESGSQNDSPSHNDQSECNKERLELKILKLENDLESSEERRSATEVRLQAAETRLQEAEQRIMRMENQIAELSKILEQRSTGDSTLDDVGDSRSAQPEDNFDILLNALNVPTAAD
ncbi:hypothetical protein FRC01_003147, partial [Tulasnella sp. 417]